MTLVPPREDQPVFSFSATNKKHPQISMDVLVYIKQNDY